MTPAAQTLVGLTVVAATVPLAALLSSRPEDPLRAPIRAFPTWIVLVALVGLGWTVGATFVWIGA